MHLRLNILAALAGTETASDLLKTTQGIEGMSLSVLTWQKGLEAMAGELPDVFICEIPEGDDAAMKALESQLAQLQAGMAIYVVGNYQDPDLLRRLMRMGVRDILSRPLNQQELTFTLSRLLMEKRDRMAASGATVTTIAAFFNTKGSSGATLLAVNAAASLALRKKARVAVLDFDLQFGAAALFLDLKPQCTIAEALRDPDRLDSVYLKALMTEHSSGVHVLASPGGLVSLADVQPAAVRRLIEVAGASYDVVILDLPRIIIGWTMEAMRASDTVFLVTQNSLSAIRDTRILLDFMGRNGFPPHKLEVINNRAQAKSASVTVDQMKTALKKTQVLSVRNDYEAAVSAEDKGMILLKSAPGSALTQDIDHLADQVWQGKAAAASDENKPGLFDRWLRRKSAPTVE